MRRYLDLLRDPLRGASERDALISEITIGETYFFRHQEHFDALRAELGRILFGPGFSTSRVVTDVSGRGTGLSVVQEAVRRLQGNLDIEARNGPGTILHLVGSFVDHDA